MRGAPQTRLKRESNTAIAAQHIVFVDSTLAGLLAFKSAKDLGCSVTFVQPQDSSFLAISTRDPGRIQPHLSHVDLQLPVASLSQGALVETLGRLHAHRPIDAVITTSEAAILPVAHAADALGLRSPGHAALKRSVFKGDCRAALQRAGVRSPRFEILSEEELLHHGPRDIGLPFVIKPTRGFGKQFSAVCKTSETYEAFIRSLRAARASADPMINIIVNNDYIVEQYVEGSLHSAEVVVREGKVECFATTSRYRCLHDELLEVGYSMPSGWPKALRQALMRYLQQVFDAVELRFGLYHVELLLASDGFYLVEINGRMMGGAGPQVYQALTGRDAFGLLIGLHLGRDIQVDEGLIHGAATVVLIGAQREGAVSERFTKDALDALLRSYGISFCTLGVQAGQRVRKLEGNVSVLGHVIVHGPDQASSARRGHEFLLDLDRLLGIETAKYWEPDP